MKISVFAWETTHDQANETMSHVFANDVTCTVSWKRKTITLQHRGKVVDVFPFDGQAYTAQAHTEAQGRIAAIAQGKYLMFGRQIRERRLKSLRHVLFGL